MPIKNSTLEHLQNEAYNNGIYIEKHNLPENILGIYYESENTYPVITINSSIHNCKEEKCIIAEELGHYYTSVGDLVLSNNMDKLAVRKQEEKAKRWAVQRLISMDDLIQAFKSGAYNKYEVAEFLDVTEKFLDKTIDVYCRKYGPYKVIGDWIIYFSPFGYLRII